MTPETPTAATLTQPVAAPTGTPTPETVTKPTPVIEKPQEQKPEKSFTQAQVDEMIKERLKREKMEKAERLEAEKADLAKELETLKQQNLEATRKLSLAGKVVDVEAAIRLLDDEFIADGQIQLEPFLVKYPFLKAQQTPPVEPGPGGRGGTPTAGQKTVGEQANVAFKKGVKATGAILLAAAMAKQN